MAEPQRMRPKMQDYGIAEGDQGLMTWDWVRDQMATSRNYWIGSTRPDGKPHAAPVWGVWVDDTLYFSTGRTSRKARNLAANPAVVVHLESGDETVILEGAVEPLTDQHAVRPTGRCLREQVSLVPPGHRQRHRGNLVLAQAVAGVCLAGARFPQHRHPLGIRGVIGPSPKSVASVTMAA